jgi:aminodeoxyfutalosine deaminase
MRVFLEDIGAWDATAFHTGASPLDYLQLLAKAHRALIVHGNYLTHDEIAFLAANAGRMAVVYCPRTHHWFAHREYPLQEMVAAGVTVALGTDGRGSSPDLNLLAEMRFAARRHPTVRLESVLQMGTLLGAKALGCEQEVGSIEPGKRANLTFVALPNREAPDPHELVLESEEPVVGSYFQGVAHQ